MDKQGRHLLPIDSTPIVHTPQPRPDSTVEAILLDRSDESGDDYAKPISEFLLGLACMWHAGNMDGFGLADKRFKSLQCGLIGPTHVLHAYPPPSYALAEVGSAVLEQFRVSWNQLNFCPGRGRA
jgi:hypothetical protein